jgi:hypothetical protein
MNLGEILARLNDRTEVYQFLAENGGVPLIVSLSQKADESGCDACDIVLRAVDDFTAKADDEAWVKLIGRLQDSASPAGACLTEMIAWSLAR